MNRKLTLFTIILFLQIFNSIYSQENKSKKVTENDKVCNACLEYALPYLKYSKTLKWEAISKMEENDTYIISGIRTVKTQNGDESQQVTCRVKKIGTQYKLKMLQIFMESSKTDKDIFILRN
jgi:hypothetical protein